MSCVSASCMALCLLNNALPLYSLASASVSAISCLHGERQRGRVDQSRLINVDHVSCHVMLCVNDDVVSRQ